MRSGIARHFFLCVTAGWLIVGTLNAIGQNAGNQSSPTNAVIKGIKGTVQVMPAGAQAWVSTLTNQPLRSLDRLRTGDNSLATLLWEDNSVVTFGPLTEVEILPEEDTREKSGLRMIRGLLSFFHRDKPGLIRIITRGAVAGIEGTELVLAVNDQGVTTLSVIDGRVNLHNPEGGLVLTNNQQAIAEPGSAPTRTAGFVANNILQWSFYYPAVLDPDDLDLNPNESKIFQQSFRDYRLGNLRGALASYPTNHIESPASKVYLAALWLAVGRVEQSEETLAKLAATDGSVRLERLAVALRTLIAAVKRQPNPMQDIPVTTTELLAASYYAQSQARGEQSLRGSLELARAATVRSVQFGFAWERLAELQFEFGLTRKASEALDRSLQLSPLNAQGLALKGFLLAAENEPHLATQWFDRAIAADSTLANAWLGRGLCAMRRGNARAGIDDILIAAALEPQRSVLRSYLGKSYTAVYEFQKATKELKTARELDPNDPTSWLYFALLRQLENRINEAIGDLEQSQERNSNRSVFRSRLLLDEDQAVRSANLASIYHDNGMTDVAVREASRAVTYDYANASAHLFLSDSYNELRDPTRFNLRYETVWFNELLLANLLAPVGGGRLAQNVSQEEYSSLFQADGLGVSSSTLARSDNKSVNERASQFGTFGQTSYALDLNYQHNGGVRPNNELDNVEWYTTVKQQVTPEDTATLIVKYENFHSGDNFQYYDPSQFRPHYKFDESQDPIVAGAWHHEWAPGVHTLGMAGRFITDQNFNDRAAPQLLLLENEEGVVAGHDAAPLDVSYNNHFEIYFGELNQIFQWNRITLSLGGRIQEGSIAAHYQFFDVPVGLRRLFSYPVALGGVDGNFQRYTGYGYLTVEPIDRLWLLGGLAYDDITYPSNFRNPPLSAGESQLGQLGPKAGLVWNPIPLITVRGAYTKSLGGVSEEESFRLEQTQVAGFPQAFRSLIPESIVGSVGGPQYETYAVALDLKLSSRTYAGILAQQLNTDVDRTIGAMLLQNSKRPFVPASTVESLRYRESSIGGSINQLIGKDFVAGLSYRFDHVQLRDDLPLLPAAAVTSLRQNNSADLQQSTAYVLFNHSSGFFARAEVNWYHQLNLGYVPALPGDDFFQENIYVGYRFFHRHAQLMLGVLNLSGQDYRLNPLSTYIELPRERSYIVQLSFAF